jgi:hypothetical protein
VAVLATGALIVLVANHWPDLLAWLPDRLAALVVSIDKTGLHPFRLVSILALAYLVGHAVSPTARWLRSRVAAPFVLMGQHGLPVFCTGIFLAFLGRLALEADDRWPMQVAVNLAGLAASVTIGAISAWYRLREEDRPPRGEPGGLRPPPASSTTAT